MKDVNGEEIFSFLEEFEKEEKTEWENLQQSKKDDCFRYLILMKRFMSNNNLLPYKHKKWILENCDLPTHLITNEVMDEKDLWL